MHSCLIASVHSLVLSRSRPIVLGTWCLLWLALPIRRHARNLKPYRAFFFKVPQWELPWGLHERLWPLKYMIFLGLFGMSLVSIPMAEQYAEVEPFKTAIILKFDRAWPFIVFATLILGAGYSSNVSIVAIFAHWARP